MEGHPMNHRVGQVLLGQQRCCCCRRRRRRCCCFYCQRIETKKWCQRSQRVLEIHRPSDGRLFRCRGCQHWKILKRVVVWCYNYFYYYYYYYLLCEWWFVRVKDCWLQKTQTHWFLQRVETPGGRRTVIVVLSSGGMVFLSSFFTYVVMC